ncbi:lytic transglycosylase domain-containing protein [Caulobacter endophyticus]|uniref:lytic transglycosylase domain-containing protein n=1 Tax=Caulobacter endophyticus TaxID=2172652 RepID=UPI001E5A1676|nr:lytic transglycosylase domain-containing protein [Caulobacter endophyticus]
MLLLCLVVTVPVSSAYAESAGIAEIVDEAAARFSLPSIWIHAVIRAESGGDANAVSAKGAVGLMQLMPTTWRALTAEHRLGTDPLNRRANVLAGSAYLRALYDRFGRSGFLAAYNAGPGRYAEALAGRRNLPTETIHYTAKVERLIAAAAREPIAIETAPSVDWRGADLFVKTHREGDAVEEKRLFASTDRAGRP